MKKKYIRLFSHCFVVDGSENSAIYDFHKGVVLRIPKSLSKVVHLLNTYSVKKVYKLYKGQENTLNEYMNYLTTHDLVFFTNTPRFFPKTEIVYKSFSNVASAVIEYTKGFSIEKLVMELDSLNCKMVELRYLSPLANIKELQEVLDYFANSTIRCIELIFSTYEGLTKESIHELLDKNKKIGFIVIAGYHETEIMFADSCKIIFTEKTIDKVTTTYYTSPKVVINIDYFMESHFYNPYYNAKVCIDIGGNIKNCLSLKKSFGNVNRESLSKVIDKDNFKRLWLIKPDKIESLRDSEFRYALYIPNQLKAVKGASDLYKYNDISKADFNNLCEKF
ncbi:MULTISPECIES: hypothetical protein [Emticicia]|uniref:hypothetical protein n=1 Tax=Emticicia TaxID=312278 RepID=UPI00209CBB38|nr:MULTISPECIES: hypothetical protein [Emticicia]UTA68499.1 hypothetical protein MB380_01525 [Emticicia sp. 21SJ11W-3]